MQRVSMKSQFRVLTVVIMIVTGVATILGSVAITTKNAQAQEQEQGTQIYLPVLNSGLDDETAPNQTSNSVLAATCARATIHQGDKGEDVRHAQRQLLKVGDPRSPGTPAYYITTTGGADADFGPGTHNATLAYQRIVFPGQPDEHDGWIGPKTWAKLGCNSGDTPAGPPAPTPSPTPRPTQPPNAHDCSGRHTAKTGNITIGGGFTRFQCRYVSGIFEIAYNPLEGMAPNRNGKTNQSVVEDLGRKLQAAYNVYRGWGLREPQKKSNGMIQITIGGHGINSDPPGYTRETVVQFKPLENLGESRSTNFSEHLVYHEVFHLFQWRYTNDDTSYVSNQGFFESMTEYADRLARSKSPCDNANCVNALSNANRKPWDPAYDGEYFFYWANEVLRRDLSNGQFFALLLTEFDRNQNDISAVVNALGERAIHDFRLWTISSSSTSPSDVKAASKSALETIFPFNDGNGVNLPQDALYGKARLYRVKHSQPRYKNPAMSIELISASATGGGFVSIIDCRTRTSSDRTYKLNTFGSTPSITLNDCPEFYILYSSTTVPRVTINLRTTLVSSVSSTPTPTPQPGSVCSNPPSVSEGSPLPRQVSHPRYEEDPIYKVKLRTGPSMDCEAGHERVDDEFPVELLGSHSSGWSLVQFDHEGVTKRGWVETEFIEPRGSSNPASSTIRIYAHGTTGDEQMDLRINGQTVRSWTVLTSASYFDYTHPAQISADQVSVHFTNDTRDLSTGYDRDLVVDKMVLNGTTFETESPAVKGQGPWSGGSCTNAGFYRTEILHCNGYFQYDPSGGSSPAVGECTQVAIAAHAEVWAESSGPVANPVQGAGRSLVLLAVAPGPAYDDQVQESGQWINPPGAEIITDFEVPADGGQYVQRFRAWFVAEENGEASYTFGYQTTAAWDPSTTTQSRAILGLDGRVTNVIAAGPGPIKTGSTDTPFPEASAISGSLAIAVATNQNNEPMLGNPSSGGWTQIINNTGGRPDRRLLGVWSKPTDGPTIAPGTLSYGEPINTGNAAHAHWTLVAQCRPSGGAVDRQIPESELSFSIDPELVETWGATRDNLQLVQSGTGWNPTDTSTGFTTRWSQELGYDLAWEPSGAEIRSFVMDDGDNRRLYREDINGRTALVGKLQWRNDGSYDTVTYINSRNVNESTTWPGIDRLFYDGSRSVHYSDIDAYVRVGPNADRGIFAFAFVSEPWMWSKSNTLFPFDFHAPGSKLSSPLTTWTRDGMLQLRTRDGTTADGGIFEDTRNNDLGDTLIHQEPMAPVGEANGFIVHFKMDPSSTERFVELYSVDPFAGTAARLAHTTGKVGYWFADNPSDSGKFYFVHQMYVWHQWTNSGDAAAGVVNNWDMDTSRVGNIPTVRRVQILRAFGAINPTWSVNEAAADLHQHMFD